jgi:hypothetical protein
MPKKVTVVKVAPDAACPPGFMEGRVTRRGKSC